MGGRCYHTQAAKQGAAGAPLLAACVTAAAVGDVLRALRAQNTVLADHPYAEMYTALRVRCRA